MRIKSWRITESGEEDPQGEYKLTINLVDVEDEKQAKSLIKAIKPLIPKIEGQETI